MTATAAATPTLPVVLQSDRLALIGEAVGRDGAAVELGRLLDDGLGLLDSALGQ